MSSRRDTDGRRSMSSAWGTHVIVLPGGGYAEHAAHEAEPIVGWLNGLGVRASVFRYRCWCATPSRYTLSGLRFTG